MLRLKGDGRTRQSGASKAAAASLDQFITLSAMRAFCAMKPVISEVGASAGNNQVGFFRWFPPCPVGSSAVASSCTK